MLKISLQIYRSSPDPSVKERKLPRGVSTRVNKASQSYGSIPNRTNYYLLCQWSALEQPLSTDLFKECSQLGCLDKGSKPFSTPIFQCTNQSPEFGKVIPTPQIIHTEWAADGRPTSHRHPTAPKRLTASRGRRKSGGVGKGGRMANGQGSLGVFAIKNSARR